MPKSDFFTPIEPAERTARIIAGRDALLHALEQSATRGAADNAVDFSGSFTKEGVVYDRFVVTINGADSFEADLERFKRLGARVESVNGRCVSLAVLHDAYDRRLLCIDWTPAQLFVGAISVSAALLLAAAALSF